MEEYGEDAQPCKSPSLPFWSNEPLTIPSKALATSKVWEGMSFFSKYADNLGEIVVQTNKDVAARVKLVKALLRDVEHDVQAFHKSFRAPPPLGGGSSVDARLEENGLSLVSSDIDQAFEDVLKRVDEAFPGLDRAAHHDDRRRLITRILAEAEIELVKILCAKYELTGEGALRGFWRTVSPIIESIVVVLGDLAEQHPWLAKFVIMG
ncbi:hypothetical protein EYR36_005496 [Pleurotus pulmonarius]|nr:hypothetical protein EYR36_005496 [Pleurotus pulmonarius]